MYGRLISVCWPLDNSILAFFGSFFQALQCHHVLFQINALVFFELGDDVVDEALVEVFAAQEGVAVGGQYFKLFVAVEVGDFDDGISNVPPPKS